jgi:hypothetical protein
MLVDLQSQDIRQGELDWGSEEDVLQGQEDGGRAVRGECRSAEGQDAADDGCG